jgi:transcriptional regulator with XRE-family HTH domain
MIENTDASERIMQTQFQTLLRNLRSEAGLRQVDLAAKLGRPQSFVSNYEAGDRRLDFMELRQICIAMDITLEEFVRCFEASLKKK